MEINNYKNLIESGAKFLEKLGKRGTKHFSYRVRCNGANYVLKKFRSERETRRESEAHDILSRRTKLLFPRKIFRDGEFILYEYICGTEECTPLEMVGDWRKVHIDCELSNYFDIDIPNIRHVEWLARKVAERGDLYGDNRREYSRIIKTGMVDLVSPPELCVVHGDLHLGNVITREGSRFYIDLESCAVRDPITDLVPAVLYHLDWKESLIQHYCEIANLDEKTIKRRLATLSVFRGTKLIGYHNNRDIKEEIKLKARRRIIKSLDSFLGG